MKRPKVPSFWYKVNQLRQVTDKKHSELKKLSYCYTDIYITKNNPILIISYQNDASDTQVIRRIAMEFSLATVALNEYNILFGVSYFSIPLDLKLTMRTFR